MSETTTSLVTPLQEAQQLVAQLRAKVGGQPGASDNNDLKAELARLDDLLKRAATRGEGQDAEALRTRLNSSIDRTASFNSLMVHEIRKPMTSIRGYTDMLAKPGMIGPMNDMQQQFIDTIRTNIIRMEGLVTDISDINKLNSGRLKLDNKMTTFGQVMMDVQKQAEPLIAEYQHTVTWDVPQGLPILNSDAKQLGKIIFNLVKNAIQYTPKEGVITLKAERRDGNVLFVAVMDRGIGMKDEEIARLGEPFYRADHELVTATKGYGLGIPIAMGLLALMDSKLTVESVFGKGSRFSFTIVGMG
jgi:signal transduction histidine kinase